jgi:hypothetical protein
VPVWQRESEPHTSPERQSAAEEQRVPVLGGVVVPGTQRLDESQRYPEGHSEALSHRQSTQRSSRVESGQR